MADTGFWSITVEVTNNAGQDLLLDPAETQPPLSWIGPAPEWGGQLSRGASQTFAASVETPDAGVSLFLGFSADGRPAVRISAGIGPGVTNGCTAEPGEGVQGAVTSAGGDPQHPTYTVQLTP